MDALQKRCREVGDDRVSGATAISLRAADILLDAIADGRGAEIAARLRGAKPVMAPLLNLAALADGDAAEASRRIRAFRTGLIEGPRLAARAAADWLDRQGPGPYGIVTLSASAAVEETLRELSGRGRVSSVVVGESRPEREGVGLAARLRHVVPAVALTHDAALPGEVGPESVVLFGADAVTDEAVWNKSGSLALALAARRLKRPVVAVTTTHKVVPRSAQEVFAAAERAMQAEARPAPSGLDPAFWDVQFEPVPRGLVTVIVEQGRLAKPRA